MSAYYNENDPSAAEWLRQLVKLEAIAPGDVDERSIVDVPSIDLRSYTQQHFFAGIGVWSYALRCAGWPDDKPVVTGSCPCQPFSSAGKRKGADDERDLWWAMFWHICQLRPETIIGEQVSSKDGLAWWDIVQSDLEGENYAATAFDLCAAGIGAPHIRQRLFWVANSNGSRPETSSIQCSEQFPLREASAHASLCGVASPLANSESIGKGRRSEPGRRAIAHDNQLVGNSSVQGLQVSGSSRVEALEAEGNLWVDTELERSGWNGCRSLPLPNTTGDRCIWEGESRQIEEGREQRSRQNGQLPNGLERRCDSFGGFWDECDWLQFTDSKQRPIKSGISPLVDGIAPDLVRGGDSCIQTEATAEAKTMRIKGYGNAIVAPLAIAFIQSVMEVEQ
ncbi:MAG: DNA cytosine methyltransferase [Cyanobacteria bacterium P01_E01_bin.6]